jgi:outer membrane protein OmpA-like peptidoglycan-associated protein
MSKNRLSASPARIAWALIVCAAVAACQSPPQAGPTPTTSEARAVALRSLGFEPQKDEWTLNLGIKLLFDTDVDTLTPDGRDALRTVARTLRELGIDHLRVEGHTDTIGPAAYNRKLSQRRAESVARELARAGISDDAIERVGIGHRKPAADNATAEGRAQNRRVVITVRAD